MKPKRPLTSDEREVWFAVTRGVTPYHHDAVAPAPTHRVAHRRHLE